jgi:septal ring factor EnvC (AmiA/AmiB activator)
MCRASGANRFAPGLRARIRAALAQSKARIPAIIAEQIARQAEFSRKQARASSLETDLRSEIQQLQSLAEKQKWSERKLAAKLGFCPRTWRRVRDLNVNPADWLSRLRKALARLNPEKQPN